MKYFALLILFVLLAAFLALILLLVRLPGRIAQARKHPQADAVAAAGFCSLLLPIPLWPLAMIWAYCKSEAQTQERSDMFGGDTV